ncbi:MAG: hypothetical protein CMN30_26895 [Sandaracinus sp.]|nr:hypothetical protein [Sandaracinus sp.]
MTMAMQAVAVKPTGPKVLRIGLIKDGKIIEERVIRERKTVSVGSSEKNHFIVNEDGVPPRFDLFQLVGNDYILNFTDKMDGRVGLPGGVAQLDQLRSSGQARNAGTHYQVKLTDASRGKIVVGGVTLLFQFVEPPPVTPRPQLPAAVRGGFVAGIDWLFTAFVVFSYMTFFGFVIYLEHADWEIASGIDAMPEELARLVFEEPVPPPEPEESENPTEEAEEGDEPEEVAENTAPSNNSSSSGETAGDSSSNDINSNAEARARIAQEAAATAEALVLGALGEGGALADVLAGGAVTGDAESVLAEASGVGVAQGGTGGNLRTRSGGGGSGEGGSLGGLAASMGAGMAAATGSVSEMAVRGNINLQGGGDIGGSGDFDASIVVRTIRARLTAIKRCYETQLRNNPTLAGKVTVRFTIVERGTVSGASATENTTGSSEVASCVVNTIRRFRFNPGPEGGSVDFSYPFVFAPQG